MRLNQKATLEAPMIVLFTLQIWFSSLPQLWELGLQNCSQKYGQENVIESPSLRSGTAPKVYYM